MSGEVNIFQPQTEALGRQALSNQVSSGTTGQILVFGVSGRTKLAIPTGLADREKLGTASFRETPLSAQIVEFKQTPRESENTSWLFDAQLELQRLQSYAAENNFLPPTKLLMEHAGRVLQICSDVNLSEPALDIREKGEVEIFCREGSRGLLIVLNSQNLLQVFGDFSGDQWRARYDLSGNIWQTHLRKYFQDTLAI